jgi:hypothetical protein
VAVETERDAATGSGAGYAPAAERPPLGGYAIASTAFNALFAAALVAASRSGRLPERVEVRDTLLIGVASHKLSRLVTKDKITAFARAPFTRYRHKGAPGEVEESPRGSGLRRAIGELLVCPYCLSVWTSAGLHLGHLYAPRATRLVTSAFSALALADFLHIAYRAAERQGLGER